MKNYAAKDVDAYIAGSDKGARATLEEVRKVIRSAVPEAEEGISWGVPFYKYHGVLAGFASFKKHVAFGLVTVLKDEDRKSLEEKGYTTGKKTIQIRFDQKVPTTMMKQILVEKARMNDAKKAPKRSRKPGQ